MSSRVVGVACAFTVAVAAVSEAKTIAWYHFDDLPLGATNLCANVITNAVDPDSLPMCARWMTAAKALVDDDASLSASDKGKMPEYVNVLPEGYSWLDGADDKSFGRNRRGIQLKPTIGGSAAGLLCVADDADDPKLRLQTFTIEMFFQYSKGFQPTSQSQLLNVVVPVAGGGWTSAVKVLIQKPAGTSVDDLTGGRVSITLNVPDGGSVLSGEDTNLLDGKLHHLAIVRTPDLLQTYVDYTRVMNRSAADVKGQIGYGEDQRVSVFFGATPISDWGRLPAYIDEIRISDVAITDTTKMIGFSQVAENDPLVSDETLVYHTFDGFGSDLSGRSTFSNMATSDEALPLTYYKPAVGAKPTVETEDLPAAALKNGMLAEESQADEGCWQFGYGTTEGVSAMLSINDMLASGGVSHSIYESDSTIEFFLKYPTEPTRTEYIWCSQFGTSNHVTENTRIYMSAGGTLYFGLCSQEQADAHIVSGNPEYTTRTVEKARIVDGKWHHIALVNARSEKAVYCYFDGLPVGTPVENFLLATNAYSAIVSRSPIRISGKGNLVPTADADYVQFSGQIDSLRVTKRALAPNEFISTRGDLSLRKGTAFYMPFDGDYIRYPLTTGAAPTASNVEFSDKVPGDGVVSNRVAMGLSDMTDAKSLAFANGSLLTTDIGQLIGLQSFTVEFYARVTDFGVWPIFAALEGVKTNNTYNTWCIRPAGSAGARTVDVSMDNLLVRGQSLQFDVPELDDRKWHHYAVTFKNVMEDAAEMTEIRLYADGEACALHSNAANPGTYRLNGGVSRYQYSTPSICFGKHDGGTTSSFTGLLDEFRISEGVLAPEDFLRVGPAPKHGILLIVR